MVSQKTAKFSSTICHKFSAKFCKSSEILLKNLSFLISLKEAYKVIQYTNFSSCTRSQ